MAEKKSMLTKVKEIISKKTEEELFVESIRDTIPENYNQIRLAEKTFSPDIDWIISITNRTDGKSFNYINFYAELAIEYGIRFMLLSRTYWLRNAYITLLDEIFDETGKGSENLIYKSAEDYVIVFYKGTEIGIITDLNNATDLKYSSNYLKKYPIMIYDEFLAIESDYLSDEWKRLKIIYQSVDRKEDRPHIHNPKIVLLGNAENFASPVLAGLDLYNILETHKINTQKVYDNVALEMLRNDNANEKVNMRAFKTDKDAMTQAQFDINTYAIADSNEYNRLLGVSKTFTIKVNDDEFINVLYDPTYKLRTILSYSMTAPNGYLFCLNLKDKKEDVIYLSEKWISERQAKKFEKGLFAFKNSYSKTFILNNNLSYLKFDRCIGYHNEKTGEINLNKKQEEVYKIKTEEYILKSLARRYME